MTIRFPLSTKLLCVILSIAILAVSLPLTVLAQDNGTPAYAEEGTPEAGNEVVSSNAEILEVIENRTASEKTFRLTDGTFYTAHYNIGIHEKDANGSSVYFFR